MSKREFKNYVQKLTQSQAVEQLTVLYDKFKEVKTYYDFAFNPNEEKLVSAAKAKIKQEYFPLKSKRPKLRRSVAQKYIKHFLQLEMDPVRLADLMLFNLEIAQSYSADRTIRYESFYKSIFSSFSQTLDYITFNGLRDDFASRLENIATSASHQNWPNKDFFSIKIDDLHNSRLNR
jgi:hypothetical protein